MAELAAADLSAYTGGRLLANDANTAAALSAALAAARRYVGWTVSPVATATVTVDGPGGVLLSLPSRHLLSISALAEDGAAVDVTTLDISRRGTVRKESGARWTARPGGISVTMSHGYTEAEAADWRRAVLALADAMAAQSSGNRETPDLTSKKVDDVEYQWGAELLSTDERLAAMFSAYRILPEP